MAMDKGARRSRAAVIRRNLEHLLPEEDRPRMRMLWGTVQSDGRVLLDNDTEPLPAETPTLAPLFPGQRVAVDRYGKTLRILGPIGGGPGPAPGDIDASQVISGVFDLDRIPRLTNDKLPALVELHSEHLDTVLDIGWYVQGSSSRATFALGYPKERSGWLEVLPRDMPGAMILQRYTTQSTLVQFVRAYNPGTGTWYPWKPLNQYDWGVVNVSSSGSPGGTVSVTFRAGLFSTPPRVHVSKQGAAAAKFIPYVTGITTSGCTIGIYAGDGLAANQTVPVFWKAELS